MQKPNKTAQVHKSDNCNGENGPCSGCLETINESVSRLLKSHEKLMNDMDADRKVQRKLLEDMDRQRREDVHSVEMKRKEDMELFQAKLLSMEDKWEKEKCALTHNNEVAFSKLQGQIDELEETTEGYTRLEQQYIHLKSQQRDLRKQEDDRFSRLRHLKKENTELKTQTESQRDDIVYLRNELEERDDEYKMVSDNNTDLQAKLENIEREKARLERLLSERDSEISYLRAEIKSSCCEIRDNLKVQKDELDVPHPHDVMDIRATIQKQAEKLDSVHTLLKTFNFQQPRRAHPNNKSMHHKQFKA